MRDIQRNRGGAIYTNENTIPTSSFRKIIGLWRVQVRYQSVAGNETPKAHIKNLTMFYSDLENGLLPQVIYQLPIF